MQIAIFGGSFDPPHQGHLYICREALLQGVDKVIVIPCHKHVFKTTLQDYDFRFRLCKANFEELGELVEVSDVEKRMNKEKNYTIDTLKIIIPELIKQHGTDVKFRLLVGADIINEKDKWEEWDEIIALAEPFVGVRKDYYPSSTIIREKLAKGEIDRELLVPAVVNIFEKENPYLQESK